MHLSKHLHPNDEATGHGDSPRRRSPSAAAAQLSDLFGSGERVRAPRPEELTEYERIAPGTSDAIISLLEECGARHRKLGAEESKRERRTVFVQTVYVMALVCLSLWASWYCLSAGAPLSGTIMGATALALLIFFSLVSLNENPNQDASSEQC